MRVVSFLGVALALFVGGTGALMPQLLRDRQAAAPQAFHGTTSILAVPFAGGTPRQVLRLRGQWDFPLPTADGRAVLVERPTLTGTTIWRIPLDGAPRTRVGWKRTFTAQLARGRYAAQERETRPASTGWRLDLRVTDAGRLVWTRRMPFPAGASSASPDGRTVAMFRMKRLELWRAHGGPVLLDASAGGAFPPVWTKDGRSLVYVDAQQRLVVRDVDTHRARVVARGRFWSPALSPDGKTIYLSRLNDAVSIPK